ncbi:MAG TPA: aminopeptidase [Gemmatimonadales bacterium]|nr:aminopeptidase [Gemmatimonadales bacterium]
MLDAATSKRIAQKIITQSARVRPGEFVLLMGGERDLGFLEDMAVAVRQAGAYSLIEYGSPRLARRFYDEVPASMDTLTPQLRLLPILDVVVGTDYLDAATFAGIDPTRIATTAKAGAPFREMLKKWKGRFVQVGNGLYPTPSNAVEAGLTPRQLTALYRAGLDADYTVLEQSAEALRDLLAHGKEIHVKAANGTDFYARIDRQDVHTSDGVISDADRQGGPGQAAAFLPAGEVYVITTSGSARGVLAMDQTWYQHKPIKNLEVAVTDGKVTGLTASSGIEGLQTTYRQAGKGKDEVGILDIGINPAIRPPAGSRVRPWSQAGMITIGIGNNLWAGGENTGDFGFVVQIPNASLTVDGTTVVDRGKLVLPSTRATSR